MPSFTCYRLHDKLHGRVPDDLDEFIDIEDQAPTIYGPVDQDDFLAKLYVSVGPQHAPGWAAFVREGFQPAPDQTIVMARNPEVILPAVSSVGAAIVLRLVPEGDVFAFTFGVTGRFLLKHEAWQRSYGLKTALNLIYPREGSGAGKLVAVDAKRRGEEIVRSRQQASRATKFETFDVDKIRDLVGGATGTPHDRKWGKRITGADPLSFAADTSFAGLGKLCRELAEAFGRDDYKDHFGWLDSIQPIHDPEQLEQIEEDLILQLLVGDAINVDLAPPEIVDWSKVVGFQYHYDFRQKFTRPELQLSHYISGLKHHETEDDYIEVEYFRRKSIRAMDADGTEIHRWSVWRCLTGEFVVNGITYVIDEGAVFEVAADYLTNLNKILSNVALQDDLPWPAATASMHEDSFNEDVATALAPALLMDKKLVNSRMQTTPVEVCDVLTANRQLIHAKLKLGSRDLSHLFSQGFVSATLLQSDSVFREATHKKIKELGGNDVFDFFNVTNLQAPDFEIIYVIVAPWRGRTLSEALPFFSKVNLVRTMEDLINRGFRVAVARVDTSRVAAQERAISVLDRAHHASRSTVANPVVAS
jgi:uncharacterized protein (TIGR04141 family)